MVQKFSKSAMPKSMRRVKEVFHKLRPEHAAKRSEKEQARLNKGLLDAASRGRLKKAERLIRAGADLNARDDKGRTPLMHAASQSKQIIGIFPSTEYLGTCDLLIENGADVNATDNKGNTALMWAAYNKDTETCKLLLGKGAKIYAQNTYGSTATSMAKSLSRESPNDVMFEFTAEFLELYSIRKMLGRESAKKFVSSLRACIGQ